MSLPHHVLIEFLATRYPDERRVIERLKALDLPPPLPGSLRQIRERIQAKAPQEIRNFLRGGRLASLDPLWTWVSRQRFGPLWAREKVFLDHPYPDRPNLDAAWDLLAIPAHRNVLDSLIIQNERYRGQKRGEIFDVMKARFDIGITDAVLDLYTRLFFNMRRVGKEEWIHYLRACSPTRKEMLLLASNSDDEARLRHRLGAAPTWSYPELLAEVMATSIFKFRDHQGDNSPQKALQWGKMLMEAGDRREKYKSQDIKDLRKDLQLEFDYLDMQFPSIEDVESGRLDAEIDKRRDRKD